MFDEEKYCTEFPEMIYRPAGQQTNHSTFCEGFKYSWEWLHCKTQPGPSRIQSDEQLISFHQKVKVMKLQITNMSVLKQWMQVRGFMTKQVNKKKQKHQSESLVFQFKRYVYGLLTKCEVKMAGYWPSSFFACLWTKMNKLAKKRTRPISTHLDRTNLVNKGFIIWLLVKFCLQDTAGSPERARWLHLARSGSQSQRAIWFILPVHRASRIIKYIIAFMYIQSLLWAIHNQQTHHEALLKQHFCVELYQKLTAKTEI